MSSSSFRPIAPAQMDVYAASCNPPRRAKRHRPDASPSPHPDEDEGQPPKRRGRRPGTLSRAAREAQRKINHSLIEKARRTKINDALATLRDLVPAEYKRAPDDDDDNDEDDPDARRLAPKSKHAGEKEFKLEILVRTVAYLQDLTDRVTQLEHSGCPRCSEPISLAEPRKPRVDDAHSRASSVVPPSRLPSISAWLPDDQRPSRSPAFDPAAARTIQLPTPPTSATCAPAVGFPVPPVLTLPSPSTFLLPSTPHIQPRFSGFAPRANPKPSPASSPVYTPDDETAASLLLRMSTTSTRALPKPADADAAHAPPAGYALTPSRLLGLNAER